MLKKRDAISFVSALAIILRKEKANVSLSLNYKYKPGLLKMLDAFSPSPPLIFGMQTCDWFIVLMVCAHIWFHALVLRYHKAPRVWCVKEQQPSAARVLHIHYFNSEIRICRLLWKKNKKRLSLWQWVWKLTFLCTSESSAIWFFSLLLSGRGTV